jgi:hypothetical protein
MHAGALSHDWVRSRHEERVTAGLRAYAAGAGRPHLRRRLRPDPCPLVVLAQRLARRRPAATLAP